MNHMAGILRCFFCTEAHMRGDEVSWDHHVILVCMGQTINTPTSFLVAAMTHHGIGGPARSPANNFEGQHLAHDI